MPTTTSRVAATPDPDAGSGSLLNHLDAAVDRIRRQLGTARRTDPARQPDIIAALARDLHRAALQARTHLGQRDDWPPTPPSDEAP